MIATCPPEATSPRTASTELVERHFEPHAEIPPRGLGRLRHLVHRQQHIWRGLLELRKLTRTLRVARCPSGSHMR